MLENEMSKTLQRKLKSFVRVRKLALAFGEEHIMSLLLECDLLQLEHVSNVPLQALEDFLQKESEKKEEEMALQEALP